MAYFHCLIGGGSSGGGYELTVTCNADFAGTTITATDGVTTLTQTCPSVSPYEVVFEIPNGGEWTISGIISGHTYSTSIDIPDSLELHSVPEGSTVLPTDDIQTWLACAGITDKSYTTLAEILADSTTLLALMSNNNAVDYLVRSKSWAGSSAGLIPTMTGDTTPSGTVTYSSQNIGADTLGYYAFDGNDSTGWGTNSASSTGQWVEYEFASAVTFNKISYKMGMLTGSLSATSCAIQAYINGEWTPIATETSVSAIDKTVDINTVTTTKIRVIATGSNSNFYVNRLQIYFSGITSNSTAMTDIGANNYCANTLLADSTWLTAICNSTYFESVLNVKVPTMTSNTAPSGEVTGTGIQSSSATYYYAFDNNNTTYVSVTAGGSVGYIFTSAVVLREVDLLLLAYDRTTSFTVQGSNDGSNWIDIHTQSDIEHYGTLGKYPFANNTAYSRYRLSFTLTAIQQVGTMQFYGRANV